MKFGAAIIVLLGGAAATLADDKPEDAVNVNVVGTLRTGVVAIGGETTGTTITSKGITWELDFGRNAELKKAADALNGKKALVEGALERRAGVEVKERWIVRVAKLGPAREK